MTPDTDDSSESVQAGGRISEVTGRWAADLRLVALPWIVGRVLVVVALVVAKIVVDELSSGDDPIHLRNHLLAWDADWYRGIAEDGYDGVGEEGLRFWPLFPLIGRALALVVGNVDVALLLIANASAIVFMVLLRRLVVRETGDEALATRAVWLSAIWPTAFVLAMGYAEALFLVFAVGFFLAIRARRWGPAIALGVVAGLTRPFAVFLAVAAAVELWRCWKTSASRERILGSLAVISSGVGVGIYLGWVRIAYGDVFLPLTLQSDPTRQGSARDPVSGLVESAGDLISRDAVVPGLHSLWGVFLIALLIVMFMKMPASYGFFSAGVLFLSLSASNLDSLERYAMAAFPFIIVTAMLAADERAERFAMTVSAGAFVGYAVFTFIGVYTP